MKKKFMVGLAAVMSAVLVVGCGAGAKYSDSYMVEPAAAFEESVAYDTGYFDDSYFGENMITNTESMKELSQSETTQVQSTNRKLIKNVNLDVETKEYDSLVSGITKQIEELGGYIENMESYNGSKYYSYRNSRSTNMTIRIPQKNLNTFLETVSNECNIIRKTESVEDVTLRYVDMVSRRDSLKVEQKRLLELMEKAEKLEDIIALEERLTDVRYEIESMESQIRTLDNQVDYSTVYMNISEVEVLTPVEEENFIERITRGFGESLSEVGEGFVSVIEWLIINIPHLIVWAIIIFVIVVVIRKIFKRRKAKKESKIESKKEANKEVSTEQTKEK